MKAKNIGQGWHSQSVRHSNARKFGKADGKYQIYYSGNSTKNRFQKWDRKKYSQTTAKIVLIGQKKEFAKTIKSDKGIFTIRKVAPTKKGFLDNLF